MKYFMLVLLLVFPLALNAADIEVGLGMSKAIPRTNGTWYQKGFPYTLDLSSQVQEIGMGWDASDAWRIHASAINIGRYRSNSWDTPVDANYNEHSPTHCNGECLPLANYIGSGRLYGAQVLAELHTQGTWRFGIEAGPLFYHESWRMDVPNWYVPIIPSHPIYPIHINKSRWAVGYVLGATFSRGPWTMAVRFYEDGKSMKRPQEMFPPIWKHHFVAMAIYAF